MRYLFTCGGTAGHINPALGVAGRIRALDPEAEILFVGAEGRMETELVPREGFAIRTIRVSGFQRGRSLRHLWGYVVTALRLAGAMGASRRILRQFRPDAALGTGGYVCYPVLKTSARMGIPTAVHESNAVPGLTTKLLEGRVDRILVGLEESRAAYRHPERVEVTGTPVRVEFSSADRAGARRALGIGEDERMVLAAFGSLGADYMNGCMREFLRIMGEEEAPFRLVYAAGRQYYEEVRAAAPAQALASGRVDLRDYIYDMPRVMAAADLIICRAGASTIGEITCLGLPAVIVPSPNVANHHQEKNARVLAEAGAARMLREGEFTGRDLWELVSGLLNDPAALSAMGRASASLGVPDATERITRLVLSLAADGREGR